ncbi:cysteine hydrolase family protein [Oceanicella sp. SM1341]|uniref:cysteine hydrolase family protein n=1 Tax=Oceanicella sp. SM1341 TaxID=1548889 RepID=UPI000E4DE06F|nr:cysteine hydrolase [Oceanicella sp. SM1341]
MHKIDIPREILERSRALRGEAPVMMPEIDPARTAHVVIDLQDGFMAEGAPVEVPVARDIVGNVNRITRALRAAGGTIVYTRFTSDPESWSAWYTRGYMTPERAEEHREAFAPGAPYHKLWDALDVAEGDIIVDKTRFSAFTPGTCDMHEQLRARGIDTLIITGTLSNCCCESTARDGIQFDYGVVFVADANATHTDAEHNAVLSNMITLFADVQDTGQVLAAIEAGARRASAA